jgi:CHAD domain-containing protein
MTADHREVEDKYDLDESSVLPDFCSLKGVKSVSTVEQQLVATYFDTADLALAQAGVVLRRRTGGEDAGWHLKLPMNGARLEIAVPLGRAVRTPPVALRRVVAGIVRDDGLAHVVTIRTDRRVHRLHDKRGEVLAELADDHVSTDPATTEAPGLAPITWREAEVELLSDNPTLLGDASDLMATLGVRRSDNVSKLSRAVGDRLPPAEPVELPTPRKKGPAADVIQLRLLTQVATLRELDAWVRHDAPESVHDMRVAVRRLRHALASYRPFLDRGQSEPLHDELGWLAALLGGPRDCEVLHHLLRTLVDDQPDALVRGPVRARIDRDFRRRFESSRADLLTGMTSPRYFDLIDRLEVFAQTPPWTDAAHQQARRVLPKRLEHDWKRLRTRVRAAGADGETEADEIAVELHDVRKAAKRVRYAAEALVPVFGKDAERIVKAHERIQTVLGDHHDDAEAETALLELADTAAAAGENAFTYGVLHARLELLSSDRAADFEDAWRRSVSTRDRHPLG